MTYEKQGKKRYFRGWTVKQAKNWIRKRFKKSLSAERIRQIFHELGLVRRKPGYSYVRADPIEQNQFIQQLTQRLMEPEVLNGETLVLFFDVATLREHPTVTYVWTEKGIRPQVPTTGGHQQIKIFGALNFLTGQVRHQEYKKYNSTNVRAFLTYLHICFPYKKILLIWDNASSHTSQLTQQYLQTNHSWLEILWLPKYSPRLNPVEQLWRWLREKVTHNHYYKDFRNLLRELRKFFKSIQRRPLEVLKTCKIHYP